MIPNKSEYMSKQPPVARLARRHSPTPNRRAVADAFWLGLTAGVALGGLVSILAALAAA